MTSNMAPIDTNDRWLLKLSSVSPIVSFIRVARAAQSWIFRRIPIYPIEYTAVRVFASILQQQQQQQQTAWGEWLAATELPSYVPTWPLCCYKPI